MEPPEPGCPSEQLWPPSQALRTHLCCAQDPEEEKESALAPSLPPSHTPGSEVHGPWEQLSQTETGEGFCVSLCVLPAQGSTSRPPEPWAGRVASCFWP